MSKQFNKCRAPRGVFDACPRACTPLCAHYDPHGQRVEPEALRAPKPRLTLSDMIRNLRSYQAALDVYDNSTSPADCAMLKNEERRLDAAADQFIAERLDVAVARILKQHAKGTL